MSENYTEDFRTAMRNCGLDWAGEITADGRLHRFKSGTDHNRNSWYVLFAGPPAAGSFGCWKRDFKETWWGKGRKESSVSEWKALREAMQRADEQRSQTEVALRAKAKKTAAWICERAALAADHPYLLKKGIRAFGDIRLYWSALTLPLRDVAGELHSLQFIAADGKKRFLTGGRIAGSFFTVSERSVGALVLCEGYATGVSIYQATGLAVVCALNCGNVLTVAKSFREKFPNRDIIIAADNDAGSPANPGVTKATETANAIHARLAIPVFKDTATEATDFNDMATLDGLAEVQRQIESATLPKESDESIRGEIVSIFTNRLPAPEQRAKIADAVVQALTRRGRFFFHAERRDFDNAMFFDNRRKRLESVRSDAFQAWISARSLEAALCN